MSNGFKLSEATTKYQTEKLDIEWSVDHNHFSKNKFMLIADYRGIRFIKSTHCGYWGLHIMYNKWIITRRFKILNS